MVKVGDKVRHVDYGAAVVTKVKGAVIWIKMLSDGIEGTTTINSLRKA